METKIAIRNYKNISEFKFNHLILESNDEMKYYFNNKNADINIENGDVIVNTTDVIFEVKIECGYSYSKVNIKDGKKILEYLGFWPGPESIFFYKNMKDVDNVILNTEIR